MYKNKDINMRKLVWNRWGKKKQNGCFVVFNANVGDECLKINLFLTLDVFGGRYIFYKKKYLIDIFKPDSLEVFILC